MKIKREYYNKIKIIKIKNKIIKNKNKKLVIKIYIKI